MADDEIATIDPVVMNLVIAKGIPSLADLDIGHYVRLADRWAAVIRQELPGADKRFRQRPQLWKNDVDFGRLALMCWYLGTALNIRYREDQRQIKRIRYTNPADLFLNGVMDDRQGTCGNMAILYVAIGWRLGWPVSLACVKSHFICRFDDGEKTFNIEATSPGEDGSFSSPPDEYYIQEYKVPQKAIDCGSDLRAVSPREMLALFIGLRARHLENVHCFREAETDYLLARHLFPTNRQLYVSQNQISVQCSMGLLEPHENGHPVELASWLREVVSVAPWKSKPLVTSHIQKEKSNGNCLDAIFQEIVVSGDF